MPSYSRQSRERLGTAETDLQILFNEVIKYFDNTILYGFRDPALQQQLFEKGRIFENGQWVIKNKLEVVTYLDGTIKKSNHNYLPSRAVDVLPYPIEPGDRERMYFFAGVVLGIARKLKDEGKITHNIRWGGDWDSDTEVKDQTFDDLAHFEIIKP